MRESVEPFDDVLVSLGNKCVRAVSSIIIITKCEHVPLVETVQKGMELLVTDTHKFSIPYPPLALFIR